VNSSDFLACDLGAESGRVMLGTLTDGKLALEEIHRFPNGAIAINGSLRWDVLRLFEELKNGLRKAGQRNLNVRSLSTDSWGVDYVLLRDEEPMLTAPYQYRDARTDHGLEQAFALVPRAEIFAETGIQFMTINTLYQLLADRQQRREILDFADRFLLIGDYLNYLFSGVGVAEESLASTTQLYNPKTRAWSEPLLKKLGLPGRIFPKLVASGTRLGPLLPTLAQETGLKNIEVVSTCSHDTGAAIAAVPAEGNDWAYLSSGTWSLLGIESPVPVINEKTSHFNFTNEAGFGGTTRLLKNIVGLWILQECRRSWIQEHQEYSYDDLTRLASEASPLVSLIHPSDPRFGKPGSMPQKISDYCRETGQTAPASVGATARCILESLALLYRQTLEEIEQLSGRTLNVLHIVGGGSKNRLLNQFSANATGRRVLAGPVEATAIGNVLVQAIAMGQLKDLPALRQVVRASFPIETYSPAEAAAWQQAYVRFQNLKTN
jgi:rhamnulokinase